MRLEKTTIFGALVWSAGILAEIIFHDDLVSSNTGIIFMAVLAAIIVIDTYFVIDGVHRVWVEELIISENKQIERTEQLFRNLERKLDEQNKYTQKVSEDIRAMYENMNDGNSDDKDYAPLIKEAVDSINKNTVQTAKVIAKYQIKTNDTLQKAVNMMEEKQ